MDELMRYRVTGALFLFALAVIVLPMIFDGDGIPKVQVDPIDQALEIPVVPKLADVAPPSDYAEKAQTLRDRVDSEGYDTRHGTRFGEPVLTLPVEDTNVWAVQSGSFADRDNAAQFRDTLRQSGYEAFLSTVKTEQGLRHRVAVGPLLDAEEAEMLRKQISEQYATEAQLMAFSS